MEDFLKKILCAVVLASLASTSFAKQGGLLDELSQTIDYQSISREILHLKQKSFKLIETAAEYLINQLESNLFNGLDIKNISVEFFKKNIAHDSVSAKFHSILIEKAF